VQFNDILDCIGKNLSGTRGKIKKKFLNEMFDKLFFDDLDQAR
jgi:hypothetical protein